MGDSRYSNMGIGAKFAAKYAGYGMYIFAHNISRGHLGQFEFGCVFGCVCRFWWENARRLFSRLDTEERRRTHTEISDLEIRLGVVESAVHL